MTADQDWIVSRIHEVTTRRVDSAVRVISDTSDYTRILGGDVLELAQRHFFVLGDTTEGRFGIDDQPKMWVKRAVELETGADKIIKLVFYEDFSFQLHGITIRCARSPSKEGRTIELLADNRSFMNGETFRDIRGNLVRIIDFIRGPTLYSAILDLSMPHEQYFHEVFPGVFRSACGAVEALAAMSRLGLAHGDVRNDHIIVERSTGQFRWIDFDLHANFADYDLWRLGNILCFIVAKGFLGRRDLAEAPSLAGALAAVDRGDASVFYPNRIMNLGKVFPYVPARLAKVLYKFCLRADPADFYRNFDELVAELREVDALLPSGPAIRPLLRPLSFDAAT